MLRPFDKILVVFSWIVPHYALLAYMLLSIIEKNYRAEVVLATPTGLVGKVRGLLEKNNVKPNIIEIPGQHPSDIYALIRTERRLGLNIARNKGFNVVVLPYTRLELSSIFISGILSNDFEKALLAEEYAETTDGIRIITPLGNLGPDDATYYCFITGFLDEDILGYSLLLDEKEYYEYSKNMLLSLYNDNTETLYSTRRSIIEILSTAKKLGLKRCSRCYAWSYTDPCKACKFQVQVDKTLNEK